MSDTFHSDWFDRARWGAARDSKDIASDTIGIAPD